jgi:hypothetical protein
MNTYEFIQNAREIHGRKYNYKKTQYDRPYIQVNISCRIHGDYKTLPNIHLLGGACPKCHNKNKFNLLVNYFTNNIYGKNNINK